jgi:hypothetical protein
MHPVLFLPSLLLLLSWPDHSSLSLRLLSCPMGKLYQMTPTLTNPELLACHYLTFSLCSNATDVVFRALLLYVLSQKL